MDDAIVVIENIDRHAQQPGISPHQAALTGTRKIFLADFAETFTTLVVSFPVMFMGGYPQRILRPLAMVLFLSLLSSYMVSVTVIPMLPPPPPVGNNTPGNVYRNISGQTHNYPAQTDSALFYRGIPVCRTIPMGGDRSGGGGGGGGAFCDQRTDRYHDFRPEQRCP